MADQAESDVVEDRNRLKIVDFKGNNFGIDCVTSHLKEDSVVLLRQIGPDQADDLMHRVAVKFGLGDALELQAGYADFFGHRHRIGKFYMSVNKRAEYQFITPHSEGSRFADMQLASFYCYENSADGGETILMNVDSESGIWPLLRERVVRGRCDNGMLSRKDIVRARGLHQLDLPAELVTADDHVLGEIPTEIGGLKVFDVLARPQTSYSRILDRHLNVYWDSIADSDLDSAYEWSRLLRKWGLLKEPAGGLAIDQLDEGARRRIWRSGVDYGRLFRCRITHKLVHGDLVILNNFTWTHANNNWSPESGARKVAAAFA